MKRRTLLTLISVILAVGMACWRQRLMRSQRRPAPERTAPTAPSTSAPAAGELQGRVVGVTDGDTVTVLDAQQVQHRIRLLGIDAPEKAMPFGQAAKQALSARIFGRQVTVRVRTRDRYGRSVGLILLEGADQNLEQLRTGMAWHYAQYARDQYPGDAERYAAAQAEARRTRRGLWSDPAPQEPWAWRRERR